MPTTHIKKETTTADPQRIPADAKKTSLSGNAFSISIMLEKTHPIKPAMRITDQISLVIVILFP